MSGLNHNQNHIVKRIETRVLQPPGGASSFSIGGYGGDSYNQSYRSNRQQKTEPAYAAPPQSHVPTQRRDSLDELVRCNIPGLEGHYDGGRQRNSGGGSMLSSVGIQSSSSKQSSKDYAAQLKAQIDLKASMRKEDCDQPFARSRGFDNKENGYNDSRKSAPSSREYYDNGSSSSKRASYASAASNEYGGPHTSTRVRAPPGGQTSFSIGWN